MKRRDIILAIIIIIILWQLISMIVNRPILPSPIRVAEVFFSEITNGLITHFMVSMWRVLASMALA
ncbi:ABC transporter permease, partial [bacterium]|nr:ABC transporter permease [bacterium]